jgi:hypothetical protein
LVLADSVKKQKTISIMEIAYALLCDPECIWLSYDQLATVIRETVPGSNTKESNLRWYFSKQQEYGYDCLPRKPLKEITAMILKSVTE